MWCFCFFINIEPTVAIIPGRRKGHNGQLSQIAMRPSRLDKRKIGAPFMIVVIVIIRIIIMTIHIIAINFKFLSLS